MGGRVSHRRVGFGTARGALAGITRSGTVRLQADTVCEAEAQKLGFGSCAAGPDE